MPVQQNNYNCGSRRRGFPQEVLATTLNNSFLPIIALRKNFIMIRVNIINSQPLGSRLLPHFTWHLQKLVRNALSLAIQRTGLLC